MPRAARNNLGQVDPKIIPVIIFLFITLILVSQLFATDILKGLAVLALAVLFITVFININIGLGLLIFIIPLSPELFVFGIPMRIDDLLIVTILAAWLTRVLSRREKLSFGHIGWAIFIYYAIGLVSTYIGLVYGETIQNRIYCLLEAVKIFEYYLIFFLVVNNIRDKGQVRRLVNMWLIAALVVCLYGLADHVFHISGVARLYEGGGWYEGQSNHMGGYLVLTMAILLGAFKWVRGIFWKALTFILMALIPFIIIVNMSRTAYLSLVGILVVVFFFLDKKLLVVPILAVALIFFILPRAIKDETLSSRLATTLKETFSLSTRDRMGSSADDHRASIQRGLEDWRNNFIFGQGFGAHRLAYYDSQIALVPGQSGLLGVMGFLLMLCAILKRAFYLLNNLKDPYFKGLATGFMGMFFAMLIQSAPMVTFVVTLTAAPFWFFTGLISRLDELDY